MFLQFKLRPKMSLQEIPQRAVKTSWYFDRKRSPARKLVDSSIERGHYLTNKKIKATFKAALRSICVSVLYSFFHLWVLQLFLGLSFYLKRTALLSLLKMTLTNFLCCHLKLFYLQLYAVFNNIKSNLSTNIVLKVWWFHIFVLNLFCEQIKKV